MLEPVISLPQPWAMHGVSDIETLLPSDVLDHAADLLEYWGWRQDGELDDEGRMCAVGAIRCAAGGVTHYQTPLGRWVAHALSSVSPGQRLAVRCYPHLLRVLPSRYQWDGWYASNNLVEQWNDAKRRRSSEVITKLREAAAAARSEGQ